MKNTIAFLIYTAAILLGFLITYAYIGFINLEFNVIQWEQGSRFSFLFWGTFVAVVFWMASIFAIKFARED